MKECINEAILESGLLSSVISEVVKGLGAPALNEGKNNDRATAAQEEKNKIIVEQKIKLNNEKLAQTRKKLLSSINKDAYGGVDLFEGTTPINGSGSTKAPSASGPLYDVAPNDPGVYISGILSIGGDKWSKLV